MKSLPPRPWDRIPPSGAGFRLTCGCPVWKNCARVWPPIWCLLRNAAADLTMGKNRSSQLYDARQPPRKIRTGSGFAPGEVPAAPPPRPPPRRRRADGRGAGAGAGGRRGIWSLARAPDGIRAGRAAAIARKTAPPPAKLPLPAVIPAALSVTGAPAKAARPGLLRHGALRLAVSAPACASLPGRH